MSKLSFEAYGAIVYRLGRGPFKAERRVRLPLVLPRILKPLFGAAFLLLQVVFNKCCNDARVQGRAF